MLAQTANAQATMAILVIIMKNALQKHVAPLKFVCGMLALAARQMSTALWAIYARMDLALNLGLAKHAKWEHHLKPTPQAVKAALLHAYHLISATRTPVLVVENVIRHWKQAVNTGIFATAMETALKKSALATHAQQTHNATLKIAILVLENVIRELLR